LFDGTDGPKVNPGDRPDDENDDLPCEVPDGMIVDSSDEMNEARPFDIIVVISESSGDFKTYLNTTLSL
jgi:hypothetical protein